MGHRFLDLFFKMCTILIKWKIFLNLSVEQSIFNKYIILYYII